MIHNNDVTESVLQRSKPSSFVGHALSVMLFIFGVWTINVDTLWFGLIYLALAFSDEGLHFTGYVVLNSFFKEGFDLILEIS